MLGVMRSADILAVEKMALDDLAQQLTKLALFDGDAELKAAFLAEAIGRWSKRQAEIDAIPRPPYFTGEAFEDLFVRFAFMTVEDGAERIYDGLIEDRKLRDIPDKEMSWALWAMAWFYGMIRHYPDGKRTLSRRATLRPWR